MLKKHLKQHTLNSIELDKKRTEDIVNRLPKTLEPFIDDLLIIEAKNGRYSLFFCRHTADILFSKIYKDFKFNTTIEARKCILQYIKKYCKEKELKIIEEPNNIEFIVSWEG